MKDKIRFVFTILFMFIVPLSSIIVPLMIALGYFIDSNILSAMIATTIFFLFNGSALVILLIFIAAIAVPIVYGDFNLMLISIGFVVAYFLSPLALKFIIKEDEN